MIEYFEKGGKFNHPFVESLGQGSLTRFIMEQQRLGTMPTVSQYIFEADSRIKKVENIIRREFNGLLNLDGVVRSSDYYVNGKADTTWLQYLIYSLRHRFGLMSNADVALLPNVAEIAFGEIDFEKNDDHHEEAETLKKIIDIIKKDPDAVNKFRSSKPSYKDLVKEYQPVLDARKAEIEKEIRSKTYTENKRYKLVEIRRFAIAKDYGQYTGTDGTGQLCYTQQKSTWDSYTNDGKNKCFLALRDDWETVECERDLDNYPYDNYGLSMVWFFVSPEGMLTNSNVRWNHGMHDFENVDNMFDEAGISDLLGRSWYDMFNVSDEAKVIIKARKEFDDVQEFNEGFAVVRNDDQYNYIDKKGELLSTEWFNKALMFQCGFGYVMRGGRCNFIKPDGKLLLTNWVQNVILFNKGVGGIK